MKIPLTLGLISIILVGFVVGSGLYVASLTDDPPPSPTPTPNPTSKLVIENLLALSNGTVSFNVKLIEAEVGFLEAVFVNKTKYFWSEGSSENNTLFKGESKIWNKDIGSLSPNNILNVVLEATPNSASSTTIVDKVPASKPNFPSYQYDQYSGVDLFDEGVFVIKTSKNPMTQLAISSLPASIWSLLQKNITNQATNQDFISILISRGDKPTGGYSIAVESFEWLESYPVKFRFAVNITDPGEGVGVTQAFTNPLVLIPIGKLDPGEYKIEVNVVWFIYTYDEYGNVEYQPVMTFKEIQWTQNLTITNSQGSISNAIFDVNVNQAEFADLKIAVDLTTSMTMEKAQKIADAIFVHVKGENTQNQINSIIFSEEEIVADYIWGINQDDMSHFFDLTVDLINLKVEVVHCL